MAWNKWWLAIINENINNQIKFKTSILKPGICDYNDAYILVKGTITIAKRGADQTARQADKRDKEVIFKNCSQSSNSINKINNAEVDNA